MRSIGRILAVTLLAASLAGCYSLRLNASSLPDDAVSMTSVSTGIEGRHFVAKHRTGYLLYGLYPLSRPDLARIVRQEAGERRVTNLSIHAEVTPVDGVIALGGAVVVATALSMVGLGPFAPLLSAAVVPVFQTLTVEGDLLQEGDR